MSDGAAWEAFCDALKRAGQQILRPEAPADEVSAWLPGLLRIVPGPPTTARFAQGD